MCPACRKSADQEMEKKEPVIEQFWVCCFLIMPVFLTHMGHLMTKPTKWHVHPAKTDQPGHPPNLIRDLAVCSMDSWGSNVSSCRQQRLWSDCAGAQADLSLRWAHRSFCWVCHEAANICISLLCYHGICNVFLYFSKDDITYGLCKRLQHHQKNWFQGSWHMHFKGC